MAFNVDAAYAISWFYAASFGRTPVPNSALPDNGDLGGLTFWTDVFLDGQDAFSQFKGDVYAIADFFVASDEFLARYPLELSNSQFVTQLYNNMLDRDPDLAGFNFWVGRLNAGDSRGTILADFANTPENQDNNPTRKAALENFILFIANDDDGTITPEEGGAWIAANPTLNGAVVDGEPPVATADTDTTVAGNPVTLDVLVNDISYNGALTLESVTAATQGMAEIVDGKIVYTTGTGAAAVGEQTFDYTIKDGAGHTATATVTVNVTNTAPEAVADTAETLAVTPVTIDVLANDIDVDGHVLTIASTTTPLNGMVEVVDAVDGQVVNYTPNADFSGTDQFTYTIDDGYGGTSTATATVTVAAPTTGINLAGPTEVTEGSDATYTATLSAAVAGVVTVAYDITFTGEATAADLEDGTPLTGTMTFAAGELEQTLDIGVKFDTETEATGGIVVTLSSPTGGAVLGDSTSVATDLLDPEPATYTLSSSAVAGVPTEEGQTVTFTVTPDSIVTENTNLVFSLSGAIVGDVTNLASGADFDPATKTFTFSAGTTTAQSVTVTVVADATVEAVEGYQARLLNADSIVVSNVITGLISDSNVIGQTFSLTTGVDNIVGTSGNDTIIGDNTGAAKQLSVADQINGNSGTDTVKVFLAAADTVTGQPTFTSIEDVWINGGAITAYTAATGTTGLTVEAPVANTAAAYTLAGQDITLKSFATTAATQTTIAKAATGTQTSQKVTLNGVVDTDSAAVWNTVDVTGAGITTLALVATGANSEVNLANTTGAAITTINISGEKNLTVVESAAMATAVTKIDASTATGNLTVDTSAAAKSAAFAFTGGSGNDKITFMAGDFAILTSGAQLDGGAGTDALVIKDTTPAYTAINKAVNFEVLGLGVTATTVDAAQLTSIKSFEIGVVASTETINNLGAGSSVAITAATTAVNLGAALGNTATDITLGTTTAAGFTTTALATTGLTSVTLTSNGTSAQTITTLTNSDNTTLTIKGSADLTITNALAGATTGNVVNASALTGKLSVIGSGKSDVIIGGSNDDTLTGGAGAVSDTFTGGAGKDKFVVTTGITAATADIITDFVTKTDTIDFNIAAAVAGTVANYSEGLTPVADFTAALAAANAALNGTIKYSVQQVGSDSWVFFGDAANTATEVVKLTGVALTGIEFADLV